MLRACRSCGRRYTCSLRIQPLSDHVYVNDVLSLVCCFSMPFPSICPDKVFEGPDPFGLCYGTDVFENVSLGRDCFGKNGWQWGCFGGNKTVSC